VATSASIGAALTASPRPLITPSEVLQPERTEGETWFRLLKRTGLLEESSQISCESVCENPSDSRKTVDRPQLLGESQAYSRFSNEVGLFPEAWNTHDSLAEAYTVVGERDLAITHYNKSLEMNPDNANATTELAKLGIS